MIKILKLISISILAVLFVTPALAQTDIKFPPPTGVVLDEAGVLDPSQEASLTAFIRGIEQATTAEIAVVLPSSLQGLPIEMYGIELAEYLKVGKKDIDNGLILIIAPNERKWRFEVGYGLEGSLTDTTVKLIGEDMVPFLRDSDYLGAITNSLNAVSGILQQDPTVVSKYSGFRTKKKIDGSSLFIPLFLLYAWLFWRNKKKNIYKYISLALIVLATFYFFEIFSVIIANLIAFLFGARMGAGGRGGGIFFIGGGGSGFGGGGFGGFGGGGFGGGGAGGGW